jgi:hypothetical protein
MAATAARVTGRQDFPLAGLRVQVLQAEGEVQLLWFGQGAPEGEVRLMASRFAGQGTAAELRAIADYLDGVSG